MSVRFGTTITSVASIESALFGSPPDPRFAVVRDFNSSWAAFKNKWPTTGMPGGNLGDAITYGRLVLTSIRSCDSASDSAAQDSWGPTTDSGHTGSASITGGGRDSDIDAVGNKLANFAVQGGSVVFCLDHEPYLWSSDQKDIQGQTFGNMGDVAYKKGHGFYYVQAAKYVYDRIQARLTANGLSTEQKARIKFAPAFTIGQARRSCLDRFWRTTIGVHVDFGVTCSGIDYSLSEWANTPTDATAIVQAVASTPSDSSSSSKSVTLAAFADATNAVLAVGAVNGGGAESMVVDPTGSPAYTMLSDVAAASGTITRMGVEHRQGEDNTVSMSISSGAYKWGLIGMEIARSGGNPTPTVLLDGTQGSDSSFEITAVPSAGGRLLVLILQASRGSDTDPPDPTVTSPGVTWTLKSSTFVQLTGTTRRKVWVYWGVAPSTLYSFGDFGDYVGYDVYSQDASQGFTDYADPLCLSFQENFEGVGYAGDDANAWIQAVAQKPIQIWEWGVERGTGTAAQITAMGTYITEVRNYVKSHAEAYAYTFDAMTYFYSTVGNWLFGVNPLDAGGIAFRDMGRDPFFGGPDAPAPGPTIIARVLIPAPPPNPSIRWFVGGKQVKMREDWECSTVLNWGHQSFSGLIPDSGGIDAGQGSPVIGYRADGSQLWAGEIALEPTKREGMLAITARGGAERLTETGGRLFYQRLGSQGYSDAADPPFNRSGSELLEVRANPGTLILRAAAGETYNLGDVRGLATLIEGTPISRYAFDLKKNRNSSGFDLLVYRFTGLDDASWSEIETVSLGAGGPSSVDTEPSTPEDGIWFALKANGTTTPGNPLVIRLPNLRIWGRITADTLSPAEVLEDLCASVGLSSDIPGSSLNVLPLDWTGEWPALADYVCDLLDWTWAVTDRVGETYLGTAGPWERTFRTSLARVHENLDPLRLYTRVVQGYVLASGQRREVTLDASPSPLPGQTVIYYAEDLADAQADASLAELVATSFLEELSVPQRRGRMSVAEVTEGGVRRAGNEVVPGTLLDPYDYSPDIGPQRVVSCTYRKGEAEVQLGDEISADRILALAALDQARAVSRRRRRKKKG